jgi:hypothetical protein
MHTALFPLRLAAASLLLLMTAACASPPPATPATPGTPATPASPAAHAAPAAPPVGASTDSLWQQIQAASGGACDRDSQCHTIGAGAKACGGPERYLPWSSQRDDGAMLKQLVDQHAAARRAEDKQNAMMSTCSVVSDPGASCRAGRCVLNPASAGGQPNAR